MFTKKDMCMAYSTIQSTDQNESSSPGDRLYNVPIYDTRRDMTSHNVDPTDIAVHNPTQMDEVDLSMAGEHANEVLNAIEQTGGYHRVNSSRENRSEGSRRYLFDNCSTAE